jgi:hypothetical protein
MAALRSPAEYYIKYLLSHPDNYTNDDVRQYLHAQDLIFIGEAYFDRMRRALKVPQPFYPEDGGHLRSVKFLQRERIWGLYHPTEAVLGALAVLTRPQLKHALEALLMTNTTPAYIAGALRRREGVDLTAEAVEQYAHFFFNFDLVGPMGMRALLNTPTTPPTEDPTEQAIQTTAWSIRKSDPRRLISEISTPQIAHLMNSLRVGYVPRDVNVGALAQTARVAAIAMSMESLHSRRPQDAREYALVAKMMHEIASDVGDGSGVQTDIARLVLQTENAPVPSLNALPPPSQVTTGYTVPEIKHATADVES